MRRTANYGFAQQASVQSAEQAFFLAQQALVPPDLQVLVEQHALAQPAAQPAPLEEPQELRAKAETARTDRAEIIDMLLITFFIDLL